LITSKVVIISLTFAQNDQSNEEMLQPFLSQQTWQI
jgi:hypothetical protein